LFIDTYLCSSTLAVLSAFCADNSNVIGPRSGVAALAAQTLEDGTIVSAQPAVGDPEKFYACLRAGVAIDPPEGVALCEIEEGSPVLGVWA